MRPLRITEQTRQVIATWAARNPDSARRRRVAEVVESLEDGTWDLPRWYYRDDIGDPGQIVMRPGENLQILFQIIDNGSGTVEAADFTWVGVSDRYSEPIGDEELASD